MLPDPPPTHLFSFSDTFSSSFPGPLSTGVTQAQPLDHFSFLPTLAGFPQSPLYALGPRFESPAQTPPVPDCVPCCVSTT